MKLTHKFEKLKARLEAIIGFIRLKGPNDEIVHSSAPPSEGTTSVAPILGNSGNFAEARKKVPIILDTGETSNEGLLGGHSNDLNSNTAPHKVTALGSTPFPQTRSPSGSISSDTMKINFPDDNDTQRYSLRAVEKFPVCFILSRPLPAKSVDKVVFTIRSHDQGWSDENHFDSVYEGSWTWFEAMIVRPGATSGEYISRDISSEPSVAKAVAESAKRDKPALAVKKPVAEESASKGPTLDTSRPDAQALEGPNIQVPEECPKIASQDESPYHFVPNTKDTRSYSWHVQRNKRGNPEPTEHKITWDKVKEDSNTERLGWEFDATNGAGSGMGFVKALREGDMIAVVARAKQPGSVNYVLTAKLEVFFQGKSISSGSRSTSTYTRIFKVPIAKRSI